MQLPQLASNHDRLVGVSKAWQAGNFHEERVTDRLTKRVNAHVKEWSGMTKYCVLSTWHSLAGKEGSNCGRRSPHCLQATNYLSDWSWLRVRHL